MTRAAVATCLALALAVLGCDRDAPTTGQVVVSAAASLTDAFSDLAGEFEDEHAYTVALNLGASSALREQILAGAPVDVFAPASPGDMVPIEAAGLVAGAPVAFASNRLVIVVPPGNPAGITGLSDFADPDLLIGLCQAGVPCGDLAREALASAGVDDPAVDTEEPDVRALLSRVVAAELDAGIVYSTDAGSEPGAVDLVEIPAGHNRFATYQIAAVTTGSQPDGAQRFVAFVVSARGRAILGTRGFLAP